MLTKEDWVEIYYAVQDKRASAVVCNDRKWRNHLEEILEKIGPDGENMSEAGK